MRSPVGQAVGGSEDRVKLDGPKIGQTWRLTRVAEDPPRLVVTVVLTRFEDGHKWYGLTIDDPKERHHVGTEIFAAVDDEFVEPSADDVYKWTRVA